MHKHRTVQFVGILIMLAAVAYLVLGMVGVAVFGRQGLGGGWSAGWNGWITIPALIATILGFATLLIFGAMLFFLAKISTNLSEARQRDIEPPRRAPAEAATPPQPGAAAKTSPTAGIATPVIATPEVQAAVPEIVAPVLAAPEVQAAVPEIVAPVLAAPEVQAAVPEIVAPVLAAPEVQAAVPEIVAPAAAVPSGTTPALPTVVIETPGKEALAADISASAPDPLGAVTSGDDLAALRAQLAALQTRLAQLEGAGSTVSEAAISSAAEASQAGRLPGADEAARIAAEMAAAQPSRRRPPVTE